MVELCLLTVCLVFYVQPVVQDERPHQRVGVFSETEVRAENRRSASFQRFSENSAIPVFTGQDLLIGVFGVSPSPPMRMLPGRGVADRSVSHLPARQGTTGYPV